MDTQEFNNFVAENIIEYIVWRETHSQDWRIAITHDSPYFFFRNKYPTYSVFPITHNSQGRFNSHQQALLNEIWQILKSDYFSIIWYKWYSNPLVDFFIIERPFRNWKNKLSLLDPEWMNQDKLEKLDDLLKEFPNNLFLHQAKCLNFYAKRDYVNVEKEMGLILKIDRNNIMYLCRYSRLLGEALITSNEDRAVRCWQAKKLLQRVIRLLWEDVNRVTFVYAWLGLVYSKNQDFSKALYYITKTINLNNKLDIDFFEPYFWKAKILFYHWKILEVFEMVELIEKKWSISEMKTNTPHKKKLFEKYEYFLSELKQTRIDWDFESYYTEILLEELLYRRDDIKKGWWHKYGETVPRSYTRFRKKIHFVPSPYKNFAIDNLQSPQIIYFRHDLSFSNRDLLYINKYWLHDISLFLSKEIQQEDRAIFPLLSMMNIWHNSHYLRSSLDLEKAHTYPLIHFLSALSVEKDYEHNFYFPISEYITRYSLKELIKYYCIEPKNLFVNIALATYYTHKWEYMLAKKFAHQALSIDNANPWVFWRLAIIYLAIGQSNLSIWIMRKVINILPKAKWARDWFAKILLDNWLYQQALAQVDEYERITEGWYRTFEPYLWKSIALFHLWRYSEIPAELKKSEYLYFWEGYRYRLDELQEKLSQIQ